MYDNTWLLYKLPLLQNRGHCAPCLLHLSESGWLKLVFGNKSLPELCREGLVWRGCWGVGEGSAEQGRLDWPAAEGWVMAQAEGLSCPQGVFGSLDVGHTFRSSTDQRAQDTNACGNGCEPWAPALEQRQLWAVMLQTLPFPVSSTAESKKANWLCRMLQCLA